MLAALNPQIVADLNALAIRWITFESEPAPASSPKAARARARRRSKTPKT